MKRRLMVLYQVCFNEVPRVQDGLVPGVLGSIIEIHVHRKIIKIFLLQNHFVQMLKIWYVALPSGPLPGMFK